MVDCLRCPEASLARDLQQSVDDVYGLRGNGGPRVRGVHERSIVDLVTNLLVLVEWERATQTEVRTDALE